MRFQPIYDIAELCVNKGVTEAVLSPGSRCAPLTLAFTRHDSINCRTFTDERSAGFVAMGIAQARKSPVAVVCTSGTALYNLAPAVAEAFFSQTPLLLLTADRPSEWIGQHDGQTIYQSGIFGRHVKRSFSLPQDYEHPDSQWEINRIINEAINLACQDPKGPVHVNAPFREPLYPETGKSTGYSRNVRVIEDLPFSTSISDDQKKFVSDNWASFANILIVAGQQPLDGNLVEILSALHPNSNVALIGDIISNLHAVDHCIRRADLFLGQATDKMKKTLQPDLLITFGQSVISKNVKLFLRHYPPTAHWHIQPTGNPADPFKSITTNIQCSPFSFFQHLYTLNQGSGKGGDYRSRWLKLEEKTSQAMRGFLAGDTYGELGAIRDLMAQLPATCGLHLANSMSVRHANFIGLNAAHAKVEVSANRGTSGIDGCTSTAVGHYLATGHPTILITGDLAFFYDRNAFWHNYPLDDLRIFLLNDHGGLIFNIIDGPASVPEASEYFITHQRLNASGLAAEFGISYVNARTQDDIANALPDFLTFDGKPKILEFETDVTTNRAIFDRLKQNMKDL